MVLKCHSHYFWTELSTNSDVYCGILENYLLPTVQLYGMEGNYIYQHDNARFHTSKQTQDKLRELGVEVLNWPSKSADMNPVEHLWSIIGDKLKAQVITSVTELIDHLRTAWLSITAELCKKLVISMPS